MVLIVFNRPELTRQVFARVAQMRPEQMFLVADGPRATRPGERERCEEVRRIVAAVDWPCDVRTNFAPENLGCRRRVISGLNWVFSQVEEAIVLEDDLLPDPSFFRFCEEMLERYRENERVAMITGFNVGADMAQAPDSYYFSQLTHVWGWATWRRAWKDYDEHMMAWPEVQRTGSLAEVFPERSAMRYWRSILQGMYLGTGPNTWDYQWMVTNIAHRRLAVTPQVNLVQNLGFGEDATHPTDPGDAPRVGVRSLVFPLRHPRVMAPARELDAIDQRLCAWHRPALTERALRKAGRVLFG